MILVFLALFTVPASCSFASPLQTLPDPSSIVWAIDMTEHGEILVMRDDSKVYYYTNNGSHFLKKDDLAYADDYGDGQCALYGLDP